MWPASSALNAVYAMHVEYLDAEQREKFDDALWEDPGDRAFLSELTGG